MLLVLLSRREDLNKQERRDIGAALAKSIPNVLSYFCSLLEIAGGTAANVLLDSVLKCVRACPMMIRRDAGRVEYMYYEIFPGAH